MSSTNCPTLQESTRLLSGTTRQPAEMSRIVGTRASHKFPILIDLVGLKCPPAGGDRNHPGESQGEQKNEQEKKNEENSIKHALTILSGGSVLPRRSAGEKGK